MGDAPIRDLSRAIIDRRRVMIAWAMTLIVLPAMVATLLPLRSDLGLSTELLLALAIVVSIAAVGGRLVAAAAAILGSLLVNWFFVEPYSTLTIAEAKNLTALVVFVVVAVGVATLVDVALRRAIDDRSARLEAEPRVFARPLPVDDLAILRVLADQLGVVTDNERRAAEAGQAAALADIDAVRTALLRAVSHDLRTPLASIKAMISGLRDTSVAWTPEQLAEALLTVDEETDRLNRLVGNLLDASRLQIGALAVEVHQTSLADVVAAALQSLDLAPDAIEVRLDPELPWVVCDATLLERSVANLVSNAVRHSPVASTVQLDAAVLGTTMHIRIIDHGPGIVAAQRTKVLAPFQRLGDQHTSDGVGLGFSIAQGFVDAMSGTLTLDDTPGGGLTVTITLPAVRRDVDAEQPVPA